MDEVKLFTPGPLSTSRTVKEAMLADLGSREPEFLAIVRAVRERLLEIAGVGPGGEWTAVLIQGSGTFALEAVLSSAIPPGEGLLVLANGVYGERLDAIARTHGIPTRVLRTPIAQVPDPAAVEAALAADASLRHVAVVHCETTTGILNPVEAIAAVARAAGRTVIVDAMSSFGGIPSPVPAFGADILVSSANKCIEGVPGFAYALARRSTIERCRGRARTVSLDLHAQWERLESDGQFRFTPPTHSILAFARALEEHAAEGGVAARHRRYRENQARIAAGMRRLGFRPLLAPEVQSPIITAFAEPAGFEFAAFHDALKARGFAIYPGRLGGAQAFRIGSIGRIGARDIDALLAAVGVAVAELGLRVSDPPPDALPSRGSAPRPPGV